MWNSVKVILTSFHPLIFQDVLSALKSCLSCDEAFQYAEYVSVFATSESLLLLSKIIINEFNIYYG